MIQPAEEIHIVHTFAPHKPDLFERIGRCVPLIAVTFGFLTIAAIEVACYLISAR